MISRELHDELGQELATLRYMLRHAESLAWEVEHPIRALVAECQSILERTKGSTRRVVKRLRPVVLERLGLLPAIDSLLEAVERRSPLRCALECVGEPVFSEYSTAMYRFVREAISNVERHARATRLTVTLRCTGGAVEVTVADDGRGFSRAGSPPATHGFGLLAVRQRAEVFGGSATWGDGPLRGAFVRMWPGRM